MKWVKRGLWVAGWCVWVWLGAGLYRELPRDLGPKACDLGLHDNDNLYGFLGDGSTILTERVDDKLKQRTLTIRNSLTNAIERGIDASRFWNANIAAIMPQFSLLVCEQPNDGATHPDTPSVVDLRTGEIRSYPRIGRVDRVHRSLPRASFHYFDPSTKDYSRLTVIDLLSGAELFRWTLPPETRPQYSLTWPSLFVGDSQIAVPTRYRRLKDAECFLEAWSITANRLQVKFSTSVVGDYAIGSSSRYVAWYEMDTQPYGVAVYDVDRGERVLYVPPEKSRLPRGWGSLSVAPAFSLDGRRILSPPTGCIVDIPTKRRVWQARENEAVSRVADDDWFETVETWNPTFWKWSTTFQTFVVRKIADGSIESRNWTSTLAFCQYNADRTLLLKDGVVYRLPLQLSWKLLALCQTILALPLVLLWAALRWRRKRRMRMAGAVT